MTSRWRWAGSALAILLLLTCVSEGPRARFSSAQQLVDQIVARHPRLIRLTIHAVPTGETENRIVACNLSSKFGALSDPEDLRVMQSKQAVILREGSDLDVTLPILDRAGRAVAAAGITLEGGGDGPEQALVAEAQAIAEVLTQQIQASTALW